MDRPTNIVWRAPGGGVLASFRYAYNALGMITGRARSVSTNEVATAYGYDDLDRLASETESSGVVRTYAYDLAGNRLSKTQTGAGTTTYTLGAGDRLASYTGGSYTHDTAGCVTAIDRTGKPDLDLTWNGQYQLTSVSTNGVVAESYTYDPLGRRYSTTSGGTTLRHVYDGIHCIADIDSVGRVVKSYTWGPGIDNLLAVTCHSGTLATTYYALTDLQGTVHGFADANGNFVARYAYDAWGNLLDADVAVSALANNRYLFQGREYSHATGLYNFRLRWYDSATGRWLSKDPIGISGGLNLYAFCANDPVNYVDPWGLREDTAYVVVGSGVGAQHVADLVVRELQAAGWDTTQMSAEQLFEALSKGSRFNGLVLTGHGTGSEAAGIDESIVATLLKNSNQQLDLCVVLSCHGNQFANSLFADGVISDTALSISYWGYSSPAPVRNSLMKMKFGRGIKIENSRT